MLIYQTPESIDATVFLSEQGYIGAVNAEDETTIREAFRVTVDKLQDSELYDGDLPSDDCINFVSAPP